MTSVTVRFGDFEVWASDLAIQIYDLKSGALVARAQKNVAGSWTWSIPGDVPDPIITEAQRLAAGTARR